MGFLIYGFCGCFQSLKGKSGYRLSDRRDWAETGVWAFFSTRSPFRPNNIGLSCVKLDRIENEADGPVLYVSGIDMMNGTPVIDIKPYVPVADCRPDATDGFTRFTRDYSLDVHFSEELLSVLPEDKRTGALQMLSQDPRPAYIDDENRVFGVTYAGYDIRFTVSGNLLTVCDVVDI